MPLGAAMSVADPTGLESLGLLDEICALSREERTRLARFDTRGLDGLARDKQERLDRLRTLVVDAADPRLLPDTRRKLRIAAQRMEIESKANLALFKEAIGAMGQHLGAVSPSSTYDSRARLRSSVGPLSRARL